jgi:peptidoglycan/LPS O-acetylase OafA/YrhL
VAAGSILVYHVWLYSSPSGAPFEFGRPGSFFPDLSFGVALFFALSGFLLYRPFVASLLRAKRVDVRRYYMNRLLRIVPAYVVILLLCALVLRSVLLPGGGNGALHDPSVLLRTLLFVQNYDPDSIHAGIGPAWSLNVEVIFYLVLPALALGAFALAKLVDPVKASFAPAAALLLIGLAGKAVAAYVVPPSAPFNGWEHDWHSVVERSFLCHADLFAFGMALAVVRTLWEDGAVRLPRRWRSGTGAIAAVTLLAVAGLGTNNGEQLSYSPWNTVVALDVTVLLALVVLVDPKSRRMPFGLRILEWRPLVTVGVISYSVFLWHEPLVRFLTEHGLTFGGRPGFVANLVLVGAITLLLSYLTYRLVELPALRLKGRRARKAAGLEGGLA